MHFAGCRPFYFLCQALCSSVVSCLCSSAPHAVCCGMSSIIQAISAARIELKIFCLTCLMHHMLMSVLLCCHQEEQNNRASYWQTPSAQFYARWKGLAAGASAESVALQPGRPILRPLILLGKDSYARSIARFTSGLKGKFRELAKAKAAPCVFPEPASHSQPSHPVQLPSASIPGMTPSVPGVPSATLTAAGASISNNARPALPFSSAPTRMHGSLAAGASAYAGQVQSTVAASKSASHLPAARPVPMAYSAAQPQPLVNASNPVQNHL